MTATATNEPRAYNRSRVKVEVAGGTDGKPHYDLRDVLLDDVPLLCHSVQYKIAAGGLGEVTIVLFPEHFEVVSV